MALKLSTASIFRTRYLANHSADPIETSLVFSSLGVAWLEAKLNRRSYSMCSSQITTWTPFYSSIKMVVPVSHISNLQADSESFPGIPNNPYFIAWSRASNCNRNKIGKPVKNACKSLGRSPWPTRNYSTNFHSRCFFQRIPFPIRFSRGMSFFAFIEERRASQELVPRKHAFSMGFPVHFRLQFEA